MKTSSKEVPRKELGRDTRGADVVSIESGNAAVQTIKRGLKPRHAQMIAFGGSIGTALLSAAGLSWQEADLYSC